MFFGFFQPAASEAEDDIATGTYADGMIGLPFADVFPRPRDHSRNFRRAAHERDYGAVRSAGHLSHAQNDRRKGAGSMRWADYA